MMQTQKLPVSSTVFNAVIFLILMLFHSTNIIPISIKGATPFIPLAFLVAYSMFLSETASVVFGLIAGTFADGISAKIINFNTLIFMAIGLFTALTVHYLFNNNIRSALMLCIICSLSYFIIKWIFSYAFMLSLSESLIYIFKTAIPSAIYTTVFVIPFYYLERLICNKAKEG